MKEWMAFSSYFTAIASHDWVIWLASGSDSKLLPPFTSNMTPVLLEGGSLQLIQIYSKNVCALLFNLGPQPLKEEWIWLMGTRTEAVHESVSDTVLPPITGLCITFGTYMEASSTPPSLPYSAITLRFGNGNGKEFKCLHLLYLKRG